MRRSLPIAVTAILLLFAAAAAANTRVVTEVIDGGTVGIGGFEAHFTGLEVPDTTTALGREIRDFVRRELEGKRVKLSTWTRDDTAAGIVYGDDGRAFVDIQTGPGYATWFNEELLRRGYERVAHERLPDFAAHFPELEREARECGLGIWAADRAPE